MRTPFKSGDYHRYNSNTIQPMVKPQRYQLIMNVHPYTTLDLAITRAKQQLQIARVLKSVQ